MKDEYSYDLHKNRQIIQFFCYKAGRLLTVRELYCLIYLADRYHLRKYGRTVSGSRYFADAQNPVPIDVIPAIESVRNEEPMEIEVPFGS